MLDEEEAAVLGVEQSDDTLTQAVLAEVEKLSHSKAGIVRNLWILAISLVVFFSLGLFRNPVTDILIIIAVLLLHETGHFAGMRLFGYQDVRMFFIPLFGAAAAGHNIGAEGYKKAIVSLLGPIPGMLLGLGVLILYAYTRVEILQQAAILLLIINAFNLLPFYPLDGGRFLHTVLFCRGRYLEAAFTTFAGLAILAGAIGLKDLILGLLAFFTLASVVRSFKISTIATELHGEIPLPARPALYAIPYESACAIIAGVRKQFPKVTHPTIIARNVVSIWERLNARPPTVPVSVALLTVYVILFPALLFTALLLSVITSRMTPPK